jgi:hypothetical protein
MRFAQAVEESFRQGATRVILAGIKGDLKRGKFTLKEWPQMLSLLQTAMETGKVKGAKSEVVKWEQIEEQRKDIGHVAELTAVATDTTHVVLASCPEIFFGKVSAACEGNRNIHMSFARSGDINDLWLEPEPEPVPIKLSEPEPEPLPIKLSEPEPADNPAEQAAADAQMAEKGYHMHFALQAPPVAIGDSGKTLHLLRCHSILQTIILPRQARDKHRENCCCKLRQNAFSCSAARDRARALARR